MKHINGGKGLSSQLKFIRFIALGHSSLVLLILFPLSVCFLGFVIAVRLMTKKLKEAQ
jgi:hypothetical protein